MSSDSEGGGALSTRLLPSSKQCAVPLSLAGCEYRKHFLLFQLQDASLRRKTPDTPAFLPLDLKALLWSLPHLFFILICMKLLTLTKMTSRVDGVAFQYL